MAFTRLQGITLLLLVSYLGAVAADDVPDKEQRKLKEQQLMLVPEGHLLRISLLQQQYVVSVG
jgi:hypothetical protein